eukprot:1782619-Rhodomonas_salina.1
MHYAAMYAHKDIVQLLKRGVIEVREHDVGVACAGQTCDRKQKNEYGRTPRDNAEWEGLMLREKKLEIWDKTYKQGLYKVSLRPRELMPEIEPCMLRSAHAERCIGAIPLCSFFKSVVLSGPTCM